MSALRNQNAFFSGAQELLPRVLAGESAKIIALKTGASPRTAEAWKRGECLPGLGHVGALIAAYPAFADFIQQWIARAMQPDFFEPSSQREYRAFIGALSRHRP